MDFMALLQRMLRAAKLDANLYEEVEHDPNATMQAGAVVLIASFLSGLGLLFFTGVGGLFRGILQALIGWVIWSFITYFVGTRLFGGKADMGEMLRVLGFAYTPMALGIIPVIGSIVGFVWWIVAAVVATRQGLDVTTGKAIGTIVVGIIGYLIVVLIFGMLFAGASMIGGGAGAQ